jgi:para-nitrobenzyl esterase
LETASADPRPFVIGTNKDENKLWAAFNPSASTVTQQDWTQHATKIFQQNATRAQTVYAEHRPGESPHFLMSAVDTDVAFRARAWSLVDQRCRQANPTWMYWFTWATPAFGGLLGSCHALDIPFAFDNLDAPGGEMFTGNGAERIPLAKRFADEVVHFATHGHPSWQQYNLTSRPTLQLDAEVTLVQDPESAIRELFTAQ